MKKSLVLITIGLLCIFITTGCLPSMGTMRNAPLDKGVSRIFNADYNQVLKVAEESMRSIGLRIEESDEIDENTWMILGEKGMSAWSGGELVRVVIEKTDNNQTTVRVYTKRKGPLDVAAKGDYSPSIFSKMELKLR